MAKQRKRQAKGQAKPDMRLPRMLLGLGIILLTLGAWGAFNGALTLKWPRVTAQIVDANLRLHERDVRDSTAGGTSVDRRHTFAVHYRYEVGGKAYIGDRIEPYDFGMQNSAGAKKLADAHRVGSTVQIAYDPDDPSLAYMKPGPSSFALMLMGIGVILGLVSLLARRMIRVGPGDDDEDKPEKRVTEKKTGVVDPEIAPYYPKPNNAPVSP